MQNFRANDGQFCKKMQKIELIRAPSPHPRACGAWGLCPQTPIPGSRGLLPQAPIGLRRLGAPPPDPQTAPPLRISGYAPGCCCIFSFLLRYKPELESRTQPLRPRIRKKSEPQDRLFEDRLSRGQGQEWSRPRT